MTLTLAGSLLILALVDSTSFGTLLIPIWLLLTPGRLRAGRILVFLGTVAAFYFCLGVALVAGAATVLDDAGRLLDDPVVARVQLVLGVGLFVWSFRLGKRRTDEEGRPRSSRSRRWRERAMDDSGAGVLGLAGLALAAAVLEVATMVPYLGATGLIGTADLTVVERAVALTAYCLVMVVPALVLLAGRIVARRAVEPVLSRLARWMERNAGEATAWIVGILGFLLARDALGRMPELLQLLDRG